MLITAFHKTARAGAAIAAAALLSVTSFSEANATPVVLDFDLSGPGLEIAIPSFDYEEGGLGLTVSGGVFNRNNEIIEGRTALLNRFQSGVGVQSSLFDLPLVDGSGANEVVLFAFEDEVTLNSITFSFADGNDEFRLFVDEGSGVPTVQGGQIDLGSTISGFGGISVFAFSEIFISDLFGVGAKGGNDEFLIKEISVIYDAIGDASPVPVPAPILMMGSLVLLGGFVSRRRRRASQKLAA